MQPGQSIHPGSTTQLVPDIPYGGGWTEREHVKLGSRVKRGQPQAQTKLGCFHSERSATHPYLTDREHQLSVSAYSDFRPHISV